MTETTEPAAITLAAHNITVEYLNELSQSIYAQNCAVGWWDNPNRCLFETLQLVSTEIAEATEGERKGLMDDHLPHRKMGEVELADALIRVLDFGGHLRLPFKTDNEYLPVFRNVTIGKLHLLLNSFLVELAKELEEYLREPQNPDMVANLISRYTDLVNLIIAVAVHQGYDINGAMAEKMAYNKTRADHKRENRALEGGKKF